MAGSTTRTVENFAAQGMERHQIMMNTEVMKHFRIMNRASVREIMLQHEKTFKEQVHDLHKLYEVQRLLMEKAKARGLDCYRGAPPPPAPPPPSACGNAFSEEANQSRQRRNFWEQVTPDSVGGVVKGAMAMALQPLPSAENAFPEKLIKLEVMPKTSNSPVRKRKIDLEQLPEDDSDDEIEMSVGALNSNLSGNLREFTHGLSGPESTIKSYPSPFPGTGLKPAQPAKEPQASNLPTGEYQHHINGYGGSSFSLFQHGKVINSPANIVSAEQNLSPIVSDRNMSSQNVSTINTGISALKSNTVFLPQADLIDRASQDAGKDAHWFYQAAEANTANALSKSPLQQQQRLPPNVALPELTTGRSHPHNGVLQGSPNFEQRLSTRVALPELSTGRSHPHSGVLQGSPSLEQRHHNNQSPPLGSVSIADWSKAAMEKQPPGLPMGAQKERHLSLSERLGDASRWLTPAEPLSQGPLASVTPISRIDARGSEGVPTMPNIIAPAITVSAGGKGLSQERDLNLWPSQNPILQLPQYQQSSIFQPQQVFPSVNQGVWLQPSQATKNSVYSQQMVYGVHSSDSSQIGYRNEPSHRNQSEIGGPWNMIGLGQYYSSVPLTPQKPPFKKPPKLILTNDGVGTDYKLVSPEMAELNDKVNPKKPTNSLKKDLLQELSKSLERTSTVQKEVKGEDQKLDKSVSAGFQALGSVGQGKEPSTTLGMLLEPKLLAPAAISCPAQEIVLPKESSLSHDATATVAISSITRCNVGATAGTTHGVFAAGVILSASPNKCKSQPDVSQAENVPNVSQAENIPNVPHAEKVLPSQCEEKTSEKSSQCLESTRAVCVKETPLLAESCIEKQVQDQKEERSLFHSRDDGIKRDPKAESVKDEHTMRDPKAPSSQVLMSEAIAMDIASTCQAESFLVASEDVSVKVQEENAHVANTCSKRLQKSDVNPCKEVEQPKGSPSTPSASADDPTKISSHSKGLIHGSSIDHSTADLANSSCSPTKQASVQSISINTHATPASDRACSSTRSSTSLVPESKHESKNDGKIGEDLQLDFDSDNLAASILLSFAPQLDHPSEEKQSKSDAYAISSSGRKDRPTDQASSSSRKEKRTGNQEPRKTTQITEGLRTQRLSSGGSQGRRLLQGQGSSKRMGDHVGSAKATIKDKFRTERRSYDEPEADNGGEDTHKSLTIKLPRVMGSWNGEAIPISRSKQLSKLNGATLSGDSGDNTKAFKGNDAFHAPTGRRSSRGLPTAARALQERVHQQIRHCGEGNSNTAERDFSGSREDAAVLRRKADSNTKGKTWGELNKTRSHPRKQLQDTSHRKTQR